MVMAGVVATISDALATVGGAQAGYRLAMVRQHLGIDLRPGMNKIRTLQSFFKPRLKKCSIRQQGVPAQGSQPKITALGVKSMSVPGVQQNGCQKEESERAEGSSTGKKGSQTRFADQCDVVHKTACKHGLTDKGCQYADKCRFAHAVLRAKDGRCFNCSGKGHSRRECASGKRSESRESQSESEQDGDAGAPESIEGGLDEAETAVQIIPEDAQAVQEVNHLLKGIAGPMLKSVGISKLKEQVSWMEVLRTPSEREPATRSRTQCRSRLNWLTEPRSSTKIP